jgi:RHS repeat-associated protein
VGGIITWYVRDATGNVMSVYVQGDNTKNAGVLTQTEAHLYGSSRLGIFNYNVNCTSLVPPSLNVYVRGAKFFELSNHLGNVLATVSDKKIQHSTDGTTVDYYNADVVTANDYYPGGMLMPGRTYSLANTNYRYGFNGKENDNDIGNGAQDYGMRIYDGRLGKFLSVDPLTAKYPYLTPYQFASNSPISGVDMDGLEYYFSADGKYFDHRTIDSKGNVLPLSISNDVRIAQQIISTKEYTIYKGVQSLHTSYDVFIGFAALLNLESSGKKDETYAIANTTMNYLEKGGSVRGLKTLEDVSLYENSFARGATQKNYSEFLKINPDKQNQKFAIGAAINAIAYSKKLTGSFYDDTKGASGWDGIDLVHKFKYGNAHRNYIWSIDSKPILQQYQQKVGDGTVNVNSWKFSISKYQDKATSIIGKSLYQQVQGSRTESKTSYIKFHD